MELYSLEEFESLCAVFVVFYPNEDFGDCYEHGSSGEALPHGPLNRVNSLQLGAVSALVVRRGVNCICTKTTYFTAMCVAFQLFSALCVSRQLVIHAFRHLGRRMAGSSATTKLPLLLENTVGPVLLRFDQHQDGTLEPVWEDPDACPSRCVEQLLLEESAAKRRRQEGPVPGESAQERAQFLREAQETALDGVQRATTAAQLLGVGASPGETQFLTLQRAVPKPLDVPQLIHYASEVDEAARAHCQELLDIAAARLTNNALEHFGEMERALSFLGQRWYLHCIAGQYAIELWTGRARQRKRLGARPLVRVISNPKKGICLAFPAELTQPRDRIQVISALEPDTWFSVSNSSRWQVSVHKALSTESGAFAKAISSVCDIMGPTRA